MTDNEPLLPKSPTESVALSQATVISPFLPQAAAGSFLLQPMPDNQGIAPQPFHNPFLPVKTFKPPFLGQTIPVEGKFYSIGGPIGDGGFGNVYACTDEWGNALAAKILVPKGQTYEQVRDSWTRELRNLLVLRHPNITYVHDAFEWQDTFYLVIERCSMTLDRIITMPTLLPEWWLPHVARDVLQGLHYIHAQGYVHKDIHPGNVFVAQSFDRMVPEKEPVWSFKIGDLGISRLEGEINAFNTVLAQWMMPPEALDPGQFGLIGKKTDIYHVGLLLLALLLKQMPTFSQEQVLQGVPRQLAERHPSKFGPIIAKALRRHVWDRTGTAIDFWRELRTVM